MTYKPQVERTVFEDMLRGMRPARFILRSDTLRVAAIIDRSPAAPLPEPARNNQVVVFPYEPGRGMVNRFVVAAALEAIADRMKAVYGDDIVVVEHTEGRDVGDHFHTVALVTRERGESAWLHDPARLSASRRLSPDRQDQFAAKIEFDAAALAAFEAKTIEGLRQALDLAGGHAAK